MRWLDSKRMFAALRDAGLLPEHDSVQRVVIDIRVGDAVVVHVQRVADERLLSVVPTLDGMEISRERRHSPHASYPRFCEVCGRMILNSYGPTASGTDPCPGRVDL